MFVILSADRQIYSYIQLTNEVWKRAVFLQNLEDKPLC
jgi:hypothetical protein